MWLTFILLSFAIQYTLYRAEKINFSISVMSIKYRHFGSIMWILITKPAGNVHV